MITSEVPQISLNWDYYRINGSLEINDQIKYLSNPTAVDFFSPSQTTQISIRLIISVIFVIYIALCDAEVTLPNKTFLNKTCCRWFNTLA